MTELIQPTFVRKRDDNSIRAELIGATTCTAAGITAQSATPVLALCRQLLAAGLDPDTALAVYRSATLNLKVHSIGEAAGLTIRDDNRGVPRLVAYRPGPAERGRVACGTQR